MRRWLDRSLSAAGEVADRPELWLPGALAWTVTVGWLALAVGVARPPTIAELTFLGGRIFTSGAWPWNAIGMGVMALLVVVAAFGLAAAAEAVLLRGRRTGAAQIGRTFLLGLVCAIPALVVAMAFVVAVVAVAPGEFNAPDAAGGPVLRTLLRLAALVVLGLLALLAGAALHAAAARRVAAGRRLGESLREGPAWLVRAGPPAVLQVVVLAVARVAYLALGAVLLRVLWAPIGVRLDGGGIDAAGMLLLVGFVAIWLCLVLGGGALHAWGSVSWSLVLAGEARAARPGAEDLETRNRP